MPFTRGDTFKGDLENQFRFWCVPVQIANRISFEGYLPVRFFID
jgi:hypothetical protein